MKIQAKVFMWSSRDSITKDQFEQELNQFLLSVDVFFVSQSERGDLTYGERTIIVWYKQ